MNDSLNKEVVVPGYLKLSKVIAYVLYVWVIIGVISLTLRVFLLLFSANPNASFTDFIYRLSADYLGPFRAIFPSKAVGETGYLDVAALFAIIIYLFIMLGFSALVNYIQNKIDISKYQQEKELEQMRQEKLRQQKKSTISR